MDGAIKLSITPGNVRATGPRHIPSNVSQEFRNRPPPNYVQPFCIKLKDKGQR